MLEEPPRVRRPDVSALARRRARRRDGQAPGDRPPSAAELGQELQRVQGELGLSVTPLPLATPPPDRAGPAPATRQGEVVGRQRGDATAVAGAAATAAAVVAAGAGAGACRRRAGCRRPSMAMRPVGAADDDDEHGNTVTVGRPPPCRRTTTDVDRAASTRRRGASSSAPSPAVVCLLAVAISLLVFGRGDDDAGSTTVRPPATQILDVAPAGADRRRRSRRGPTSARSSCRGRPSATARRTCPLPGACRRRAGCSPQNTDAAVGHVRAPRGGHRHPVLPRRGDHRPTAASPPRATSPAADVSRFGPAIRWPAERAPTIRTETATRVVARPYGIVAAVASSDDRGSDRRRGRRRRSVDRRAAGVRDAAHRRLRRHRSR